MKTYTVFIGNGTGYKGVTNWEEWEFDDNFMNFTQNSKLLILPKSSITEISEN